MDGNWGVEWMEFDRQERKVERRKTFATKAQRDAFVKRLEKKDNFLGIFGWLEGNA